MYKGKQSKSVWRKPVKTAALLVSLLLLVGAAVGGTIAFLVDTSGPLTNQFTPSKVTTKVEEHLEGATKSNVCIHNTGDTKAWIRAAVIITWKNDKGEVYGQMPVTEPSCQHQNCDCDYRITYGTANGWSKAADGFWYYDESVAANGVTKALITTCTAIGTAPADGYYLNVEILGSGIQAEGMGAEIDSAQKAWAEAKGAQG
jgi:hypothetical protein